MITYIIGVLVAILTYCVIFWVVGIVGNADEDKVMSLHTYCRLCKNRRVFDIDMDMGIGYRRESDDLRDRIIPRWTWYPIFVALLIGNALHKDVI